MGKEFKYQKGVDGSHIHNCYVMRREGDLSRQIFRNDEGIITAFLNGYAIIPIGHYARLVELASPNDARLKPIPYSMQNIKDADKDLYGE